MVKMVAKPVPLSPEACSRHRLGHVQREVWPIFCHARALEAAIDDAEADLLHERGGFLLGGVFEDRHPYIEIQAFVPAEAAVGAATSMTFTHESWSAVHRQIATRFPGLSIVGWQHTHPGLGIFLSHQDRFIQRHFFSEPGQVALVIDPRQHELGFFQWRGSELVDTGFIIVPTETAARATTSARTT